VNVQRVVLYTVTIDYCRLIPGAPIDHL
jgi:hypothetical protein